MNTEEMMQFKGLRNDLGKREVPQDYFYSVLNITQDDIAGFNKVLCPALISKVDSNNPIDGIFSYPYLDVKTNNNVTIQKMVNTQIVVCGGKLYTDIRNPKLVHSGLKTGKCQATIYNDKLFMVNGKDYITIYNGATGVTTQMGAPEAIINTTAGALTGKYYYAITYVTAGGEEVLGTVSNTVTLKNGKVTLNLPFGYTGTLSRKIYRTTANGSVLKLLTTISDNTTLTYADNNADSSLGSQIPDINNECPRPKYITTSSYFNLVCAGDEKFPSQCYISETNIEVINKAKYTDISNRGQDNSPITGLSDDYDQIIVGTKKQIYFLDVSTTTPSVRITRANIGVLDGFTMVKMPSNSGFAGGVMFVASDRTVRVINGNYSDPVPTSLDNIKTENWAQPIRGSLSAALGSYRNLHAQYYDYKYHLCIDSKIYVFDTRTLAWQLLEYRTENRLSIPNVLVNIDDEVLYNGRFNGGFIEKMYADTLYMGEDLPSYVKFPSWCISENLKFFRELHIYYIKHADLDVTINWNIGGSTNSVSSESIIENQTLIFNNEYFDNRYFGTSAIKEDYKVVHLNQYGTWIDFGIELNVNKKVFSAFDSNLYDARYFATEQANLNPFGNMSFIRGIRVLYNDVSNAEAA